MYVTLIAEDHGIAHQHRDTAILQRLRRVRWLTHSHYVKHLMPFQLL